MELKSDRARMDDLQRAAKMALPDYVYGYFSGSAGGGESERDAAAQWDAVRFRPRAFTNTSAGLTGTSVLGVPPDTPVLAAPMAQQNAATPLAELATARAVRRAGSLLGVSLPPNSQSTRSYGPIRPGRSGWLTF